VNTTNMSGLINTSSAPLGYQLPTLARQFSFWETFTALQI